MYSPYVKISRHNFEIKNGLRELVKKGITLAKISAEFGIKAEMILGPNNLPILQEDLEAMGGIEVVLSKLEAMGAPLKVSKVLQGQFRGGSIPEIQEFCCQCRLLSVSRTGNAYLVATPGRDDPFWLPTNVTRFEKRGGKDYLVTSMGMALDKGLVTKKEALGF